MWMGVMGKQGGFQVRKVEEERQAGGRGHSGSCSLQEMQMALSGDRQG